MTENSESQRLQQRILELEQQITEKDRLLAENQKQMMQAEKMASLGQLVAGVAHEINTPLAALASNNDLFIRSIHKLKAMLEDPSATHDGQQANKVRELIRNIEELNEINKTASRRIVEIVSSLRNFARLDRAEKNETDLHAGIESTLTLVHHQVKGRIEVERDYGDVPKCQCYPSQLGQVYMNLLVNASQAIEGKGTITIRTRHKGGWVTVEIIDTGKGMPEEIKKQIFEPGFTTKETGEGTGLGLAIVKQIIADHGGKIEVESEPGKGTTFRILIPVG